jgi:hypothetical protein
MTPTQRDVLTASAAHAHRDSEPSDKGAARRHGVSQRTANRWHSDGRGSPAERFGLFLLSSSDPWRMIAHTKAVAARATIETLTRAEVIVRFRQLHADILRAYATTLELDSREASQIERSAADERMAGLLEERSALRLRMAAEKITDAELWGR